jgi:acyl-coenzyme A synthetase/AMP-(fatty) acid ligase
MVLPGVSISHIGSRFRLCRLVTFFLSGAGHLFPGVKARVVKLDGTEAGYDEPGELIIWTPSRALGYYNNEQA